MTMRMKKVKLVCGTIENLFFPSVIRDEACDELIADYNGLLTKEEMINIIATIANTMKEKNDY